MSVEGVFMGCLGASFSCLILLLLNEVSWLSKAWVIKRDVDIIVNGEIEGRLVVIIIV